MPTSIQLIVCVNQRLTEQQRSCAGSGSLDYIAEIRQQIQAQQLEVTIIERECLGKCAKGPVMRIAPGGQFFTEVNSSVLNSIIQALKVSLAKSSNNQAR